MNIRPILFTVCLAVLIQGCTSNRTSWRESVSTFDQKIIVLNRTESRQLYATGLGVQSNLDGQRLSASIPQLGEVVWKEEGASMSQPIGFDVIDGVPWLIQENDYPCKLNPTPEAMRIFRYLGGKWEQVRSADAPKQLRSNLTQYNSSRPKGGFGSRPYFGSCDADRSEDISIIENREAFLSLRFPNHCGQSLDELQDSLLTSRNCGLKGYPLSESFRSKWDAYQSKKTETLVATITNNQATPSGQFPRQQDGKRFYVPPAYFVCIFDCGTDQISQLHAYVPPHEVSEHGSRTTWDGNHIYEFLLSGQGKKRFYASVRQDNRTELWCDRQGFKILTYALSGNHAELRATVFDHNAELVGKWNIEMPKREDAPELYSSEDRWAFIRGLDVEEGGSLRVLIGQAKKPGFPVYGCYRDERSHREMNLDPGIVELRAK